MQELDAVSVGPGLTEAITESIRYSDLEVD
jgi:hypothetical protein